MFITIDVVFHENSLYFSSEPEIQGENIMDKFQSLVYNEEDEIQEIDVGNLDISGLNLDLSGDDSQTMKGNDKLNLRGLSVDPNGDENLGIEATTSSQDESLIPRTNDIPN